MERVGLPGKVQTVLGAIDADSLGITLVHEHLLHDMTIYFVEPAAASDRSLAHEPLCLDNLYWVRLHESSNIDNLKLTDERLATEEAMVYKLASGDTLVELTTSGAFGRDPIGLAHIARATGLNIIMGAGHYMATSNYARLATKPEEEFTEDIIRDITIGVGQTGIRAGIIGEIQCSLPLEDNERRILRCCATAQRQTGAPLSIHPSPSDDLVLEIIEILHDAGADLSHTIIGHVDVTRFSRNTCHKLADAGCYIAYDNFGLEGMLCLPGLGPVELNDMQRLNDIIQIIADGYENHVLVSQDIATKHRLTKYGGFGYAHILRDILPVMRDRGISENQIQKIFIQNPRRVLSFS